MQQPATIYVIVVAVTLMCTCGCEKTGGHYGVSAGGSNWTNVKDDPTPGIDAASVSVITLYAGPPEGIRLVVWSDLPNDRSGSGGGNVGGASYTGRHGGADGRQITFHAETTDGKTATITIADTRYDLANGSLFLVSTQNTLPQIIQIDRDTTDFSTSQDLMRKAVSIEAIRNFFEEQKSKTHDD